MQKRQPTKEITEADFKRMHKNLLWYACVFREDALLLINKVKELQETLIEPILYCACGAAGRHKTTGKCDTTYAD